MGWGGAELCWGGTGTQQGIGRGADTGAALGMDTGWHRIDAGDAGSSRGCLCLSGHLLQTGGALPDAPGCFPPALSGI